MFVDVCWVYVDPPIPLQGDADAEHLNQGNNGTKNNVTESSPEQDPPLDHKCWKDFQIYCKQGCFAQPTRYDERDGAAPPQLILVNVELDGSLICFSSYLDNQ